MTGLQQLASNKDSEMEVDDTVMERWDDEESVTRIPFSVAFRKQLGLEMTISAQCQNIERLQVALFAKEDELRKAHLARKYYQKKYYEWKETCKELTDNHHREARDLSTVFETWHGDKSALIARFPLIERQELGKRIAREYEYCVAAEAADASSDCAADAAANAAEDAAAYAEFSAAAEFRRRGRAAASSDSAAVAAAAEFFRGDN